MFINRESAQLGLDEGCGQLCAGIARGDRLRSNASVVIKDRLNLCLTIVNEEGSTVSVPLFLDQWFDHKIN